MSKKKHEEDYKYDCQGKIRRTYVCTNLIMDKLYERASNYGTEVDGMLWDDINHVNDELLWYESNFNHLMTLKEFEDSGQIHVNPRLSIDLNSSADIDFPEYVDDTNLEIYNEKCCCTNCLIKSRIPVWYRKYDIIKQNDIFYIDLQNQKVPISDLIKTNC